MVLRHVGELSYQEVAQILESPVGTVKAQVSRGLAALRSAPPLAADLAAIRRPTSSLLPGRGEGRHSKEVTG